MEIEELKKEIEELRKQNEELLLYVHEKKSSTQNFFVDMMLLFIFAGVLYLCVKFTGYFIQFDRLNDLINTLNNYL